jgi:hypothetical protein
VNRENHLPRSTYQHIPTPQHDHTTYLLSILQKYYSKTAWRGLSIHSSYVRQSFIKEFSDAGSSNASGNSPSKNVKYIYTLQLLSVCVWSALIKMPFRFLPHWLVLFDCKFCKFYHSKKKHWWELYRYKNTYKLRSNY